MYASRHCVVFFLSAFRYSSSVLKIYNIRYVHYRFSRQWISERRLRLCIRIAWS